MKALVYNGPGDATRTMSPNRRYKIPRTRWSGLTR